MCSGPFRGASETQQLARLHRKGPHRLEAWRSGSLSKSRILHTLIPASPILQLFYARKRNSHRCQNLSRAPCWCDPCASHGFPAPPSASAGKRAGCSGSQTTASGICRSKLHVWGLGGWVLLGPMGLVVPWRVPKAVRPSKEACGGAAKSSKSTTSPRFQ